MDFAYLVSVRKAGLIITFLQTTKTLVNIRLAISIKKIFIKRKYCNFNPSF